MKQTMNNLLSFFVTLALMFLMMYLFIKFAYATYFRLMETIEVIKEFVEEKERMISELFNHGT
jgi:hypothetical protein